MAPLAQRTVTLALAEDGPTTLALVADTHSSPHPRVAEHLRALRPTAILHAGDIGDLTVLDQLAELAPTFAVRGNIDVHAPEVPDDLVLELHRGARLALRVFMTHIAVYGPKLRAEVRRRAQAAQADVVVCGHSHVPFIARDGKLTVFNPGSIGPRRFHLPIVFGVMTLADGKVRLAHVDCETGTQWAPEVGGDRGRG